MTRKQTSQPSSRQSDPVAEACLLMQAEDGSSYLLPVDVLERFRISEEQRSRLAAHLTDAEGVQGYYYGPSGNVGVFPNSHPVVIGYAFGIPNVIIAPYQDRSWGVASADPTNFHPPLR